ncbi:unnamed protein product [Mytilus coruscus]|uniref:Fibrinogen C-terminal domain-containing protein n=1 Tax=Mytilus coruscus TaxID=42192 RepID=A0A6J8ABP6_MYTCO|nr:unnamed protein product [Mytilus coruscus]
MRIGAGTAGEFADESDIRMSNKVDNVGEILCDTCYKTLIGHTYSTYCAGYCTGLYGNQYCDPSYYYYYYYEEYTTISGGAIAGVVIGILVSIGIFVLLVVLCIRGCSRQTTGTVIGQTGGGPTVAVVNSSQMASSGMQAQPYGYGAPQQQPQNAGYSPPHQVPGNDNVHFISANGDHDLSVYVEDFNGLHAYANYSHFEIGDESTKYLLDINGYVGDAGDGLSNGNAMKFSTKDSDNDIFSGHCAVERHAGWWFRNCDYANLNGKYNDTKNAGNYWWAWKRNTKPLKKSIMMIKRK